MFSILLVDDEKTERDGIAFLLRRGGFAFDVFQAANGKLAWEIMQREQIDVLLTDIKMPYMDGLELSKLVSEYFPDTIIVIFSAYHEFEYAKRAMETKAINYLLKPIEVDEFDKLIQQVTELCETAVQKRVQRTIDAENQKKLTLMRALSETGADEAEIEEQFSQCGLELGNKYFRLMHIQTQQDFFIDYRQKFQKLLDGSCPFDYLFASFYPDAAYLLLYGDAIIKTEAVADFATKLCRDMRLLYDVPASLLCGASSRGIGSVAEEAVALAKCRKQLYTVQDSVLFIQDDPLRETHSTPELEQARSALETAIERRQETEIKLRLQEFFQQLRKNKALGSIYLHHALVDLITRLYIRYDRYSSQIIAAQMEELINYQTIDEIEAYMLSLANSLTGDETDENEDGVNTSAVKKVLRIIQREYASPLSLDYLAQRVGVTPSYLSYLFKHDTGDSLVKYLTEYRLKQARRMLEEGSVKVNQVAKACGYENPSYFNRIFKARFGVTPSTVRGQED